jgi:hypothetical protein
MSKPNYERWDDILAMLKSGALGDETSPTTLLKYWQMLEAAGYPSASENVKYFKELVEKEGCKMSGRYIDADALKEQCFKFANDVSRSAMAFVQGQINAAPTADVVEVRHGKWQVYLDGNLLMCSSCKTTFFDESGNGGTNYCPHCGAKMDGERREV